MARRSCDWCNFRRPAALKLIHRNYLMSFTKHNTRRIAFTSFLLPLVVFALFPGRTGATLLIAPQHDLGEDADNRLLSLLDERIQQRFGLAARIQRRSQDIDNGFGYRRIVNVGETPHRFKPENAKELKVVDALRVARLNVVLYLAGRRPPGEQPDAATIVARKLIQGPAFVVSTNQQNADLPGPAELWAQSRTALLAFQSSQSYDFAIGKWKFSARPVRATEQSCVDCHNAGATRSVRLPSTNGVSELQITKPLRIGDLLGVVLYAYEHQTK